MHGNLEDRLRNKAIATVQIDNEQFRVTEWRFPPDTETGWHRHELDYVVVPTAAGHMSYETADGGQATLDLVVGESYAREAGSEHNVVNPGPGEFVFVEIEAKQL